MLFKNIFCKIFINVLIILIVFFVIETGLFLYNKYIKFGNVYEKNKRAK